VDAATKELQDAGFKVTVTGPPSVTTTNTGAQIVTDQSPSPGATADKGSTVNIVWGT
jgi:beta-lactam-binding protein with PASTA domain